MALHRIKRGLDLPITGEPQQEIRPGKPLTRVAVLADDVIGLRPRMRVAVGDAVLRGTPLFDHRKVEGVVVTSPAAGTVEAIHRGERRALQSVVIRLSDDEREGRAGKDDTVTFRSYRGGDAESYGADGMRALLSESGLWCALRQRPFSTIPGVDAPAPHAIFVTAIDTQPLAPDLARIVAGRQADLATGLAALTQLTAGNVYVCKPRGMDVPPPPCPRVVIEEFAGKHPAGNVGLHIHRLAPVGRNRVVWHVGVQDVLAMGALVSRGELDVERVISLAGPSVRAPGLVRTRLGACLDELCAGEVREGEGETRVVSGSVLAGRAAAGDVHGYLGRYHQQVSVLREGRQRFFLGWMSPGLDKFSTIPTFLSALLPGRRHAFTTTTNGSVRAIVPIGMYERVMPMDILPTFLLRALAVGDIERAEQLGALELDEEDLALCTFVCPGKNDYGPLLRRVLDEIRQGG